MSLEHLLVVDLGVGMAAALVAKSLADHGARVLRPNQGSSQRDPFDAIYPAHRTWRARAQPAAADRLPDLLDQADVCIIGGESHPGFSARLDVKALRRDYPSLIVVDLAGDGRDDEMPAVDLLAQARTGLVHEQFSDRPIAFATPLPTYGAALLALIGMWAALFRRLRTKTGDHVRTSLEQGVGLFWSPFWMQAEHPDTAFSTITPKDCRHLVFQCADGGYVQMVLGIPGAVAKLYAALCIDAPADPSDRGVPRPGAPVDQYFGNLPLIAAHTRMLRRDDVLERLRTAGLATEPVLEPGDCWNDPQVQACGLIKADAQGHRAVGSPIELFVGPSPALAHPRPQSSAPITSKLPLQGVRIVDLGNFVAGPFASRLLGELGADVIKVESPSGSATISGVRTVYSSNCHKRSLCLDLKSSEGRAVLASLCSTADAVHHNFRVGVAERIGASPEQLRAHNPNLVILETTAYGLHGPKRLLPGFDMVMQALCGHEARAGGDHNPPLWIRSPLVDYATGAVGAVAMLMALYHRERTGCPVRGHTSLLATSLFLQSELVWSPAKGFSGAPPMNQAVTGPNASESLYETRDGWIAVVLRDDAAGERFAQVTGLRGLPAKRLEWGATERLLIANAVRQWSQTDLLHALHGARVWATRCVEDGWQQVVAARRGPLGRRAVEVQDPRYGRVDGLVGTLVEFGELDLGTRHLRAAPRLGEHSHEVLRDLGYQEGAISRLIEQRVVGG